MPLQILDATNLEHYHHWCASWEKWPQREVFAHPAYVRLFASPKVRPLCALMQTPDGTVLYPFLLRSMVGESFWSQEFGATADITSPYGYGGIFFWGGGDRLRLAEAFWTAFDRWAEEEKIVSEFVRFSLFPESLLPYRGHSEQRLLNVVRDLSCTPEVLWMDVEHKVRKNVNKAKRNQLTVEIDSEGARLDQFLHIYQRTMDRRGAGQSYYFPRPFFEQIVRDLAGQFVFFHVLHEGRLVSTELVLLSAENIYSFLGGTEEDAFDLRPNDLLKYEIMLWAQCQGKRRFVLGGGYGGEDGIFRYKLGFAPSGTVPFLTGQHVLNRDLYLKLCVNRSQRITAEPHPSFFPQYRA